MEYMVRNVSNRASVRDSVSTELVGHVFFIEPNLANIKATHMRGSTQIYRCAREKALH